MNTDICVHIYTFNMYYLCMHMLYNMYICTHISVYICVHTHTHIYTHNTANMNGLVDKRCSPLILAQLTFTFGVWPVRGL